MQRSEVEVVQMQPHSVQCHVVAGTVREGDLPDAQQQALTSAVRLALQEQTALDWIMTTTQDREQEDRVLTVHLQKLPTRYTGNPSWPTKPMTKMESSSSNQIDSFSGGKRDHLTNSCRDLNKDALVVDIWQH
jgi:hypothetical protein